MFFYRIQAILENLQSALSFSGYNVPALWELLKEKTHRLMTIRSHEESLLLLDEITAILDRLDPAPSTTIQAIDTKGQDFGTYFVAAYAETRNLELSFQCYRTVKDLIRYILLMDTFYEVGNQRYRKIAKTLYANLLVNGDQALRYTLRNALELFWPFWRFEQKVKKMMMKGHRFSKTEIRRFNLMKSSDAPRIYCSILDLLSSSFNPNIALIFHYNQALQDIDDDLDDIEEDMRYRMPNIFVLTMLSDSAGNYAELVKPRSNLGGSSVFIILDLVDQYSKNIESITIPERFFFLKLLGKGYAEKIRKKLRNYQSDALTDSQS